MSRRGAATGARVAQVRDILSSFDRNKLPSEYEQEVCRRINAEQGHLHPTEWTRSGDLKGTLMQWGVHDNECWSFLNRCQPQGTRTRLYNEKINRRLQVELEQYSKLQFAHDNDTGQLSPRDVKNEVKTISQRLNDIVNAILSDRLAGLDATYRATGDRALGNILVTTLEQVCNANRDISGAQRRRTSTRSSEVSLYNDLIRKPEAGTDDFMMDLLDSFSDEVLIPLQGKLNEIYRILGILRAPAEYRTHLSQLLRRLSMR